MEQILWHWILLWPIVVWGAYNNSTDNYYVQLDIGSHKYLIIALEYFSRSVVLTWAQGILNANTNREVIVATHSYLNPNGTRTIHSDPFGLDMYGGAASIGCLDSQQVWMPL